MWSAERSHAWRELHSDLQYCDLKWFPVVASSFVLRWRMKGYKFGPLNFFFTNYDFFANLAYKVKKDKMGDFDIFWRILNFSSSPLYEEHVKSLIFWWGILSYNLYVKWSNKILVVLHTCMQFNEKKNDTRWNFRYFLTNLL